MIKLISPQCHLCARNLYTYICSIWYYTYMHGRYIVYIYLNIYFRINNVMYIHEVMTLSSLPKAPRASSEFTHACMQASFRTGPSGVTELPPKGEGVSVPVASRRAYSARPDPWGNKYKAETSSNLANSSIKASAPICPLRSRTGNVHT